MALCLCLSLRNRCFVETDGRIKLVYGMGASFDQCILRKFRYLQNNGIFLNSGLISPRHFDCRTCYQLSSSKVDVQSVINWTVVGQLS